MPSLSRNAVLRIAPFAAFMILLAIRGAMPGGEAGDVDPRWVYGLTVLVVGGLLMLYSSEYGELARANAPELRECGLAVVVGLGVFALWIHLDADWMRLGTPTAAFTPLDAEGTLDWSLVAVRIAGAVFLVPVMEELFWRSFLMRWIDGPQFEMVDPRNVGLKAVLLSTFVFVLAHTLWLAALVAGLAYALLYRRTGRLWVAVLAHAVTNAALAAWVLATGQWQYW